MKHPLTGQPMCPWCRKPETGEHSCFDAYDVLEKRVRDLEEALALYRSMARGGESESEQSKALADAALRDGGE